MNLQKCFLGVFGLLIFLGVVFRLWGITANDFIFYDEGYYLDWNRPFGEALQNHHLPLDQYAKAAYAYVSRCLASGKTLWFMLSDSRLFWGGLDQWFLARVWAAVLGILTLFLTYRFSFKFFNNHNIALTSSALLAILPSHVFYSRIGMQEALSAFLVLSAFYFYLFPSEFGKRTFLAGTLFGFAYFSNYRLIMLPVLITFCEIYLAFSQKRNPDVRKWLWTVLVFFLCVFGIGSFNKGQNIQVIFSWVFHQTQMAKEQLDWLNLFSYPYYLFRLETLPFALGFFLCFYFVYKKEWRPLLPAALVLLQMAVFTFASEKGARYVGIVLPFMAMTVAYVLFTIANQRNRVAVIAFAVLMVLGMTYKSFTLVRVSPSDYRASAEFLKQHDAKAKILSTQPYVQKLYFKDEVDVKEVSTNFQVLINQFQSGYSYLVVCPQAYISMTQSGKRFDPPLAGYLQFLVERFRPNRVYEHLTPALLERFVFEHNENLGRSIKFLAESEKHRLGVLRIYDLRDIIPEMLSAASRTRAASR